MKLLMLSACVAFLIQLASSQYLDLDVYKNAMKQCKRDTDCPKGYCCVSMMFWRKAKGHCAPYLKKGESCIPDPDDLKTYNNNYFLACPCETGLECTPSYYEKTPIGKVGFNETCSLAIRTTTTTTSSPTTSTEPKESVSVSSSESPSSTETLSESTE